MKNQVFRPSNTQSGSIFVWIFVMIALFAAFSFAVSKSSRTGVGSLSKEKARLVAQEIIQAGTQVRDAVKILQLDGCTDTQISFEGGPSNGNYTNALAPADGHCDVYGNNGGKLRPPEFGDGWGNERLFFGANVVESHDSSMDYGTSAPDLTMLRQVSVEVCSAINDLLISPTDYWQSPSGQKHGMWESEGDHNGGRDGTTDAMYQWHTFQGDYTNAPGTRITINDNSYLNSGGADNTRLPPASGCFCESDDECDADTYPGTTYYYYNILISR